MTLRQYERRLVRFLANPRNYPHPVGAILHRETHVSRVFLAGEFAYKLKKPVRFAFQDSSTAARRRYWCARELRLNRRLAPELYLGLIPLIKARHGWRFGGKGRVVEWLIRMRRLPESRMLDRLVASGGVRPRDIDRIMARLIPFFKRAARSGRIDAYAAPAKIRALVLGNLEECRPFIGSLMSQAECARLEASFRQYLWLYQPLLRQRLAQGRIIDGHGDLRCENICLAGYGKPPIWFKVRGWRFEANATRRRGSIGPPPTSNLEPRTRELFSSLSTNTSSHARANVASGCSVEKLLMWPGVTRRRVPCAARRASALVAGEACSTKEAPGQAPWPPQPEMGVFDRAASGDNQSNVTIFDCVEHQDAFRCGDIISDLSFLVMDLAFRRRADLAQRAVDRYRQALRDPAVSVLLPFYACHRSLVRAKVRGLAWRQHPASAPGRRSRRLARRHVELALAYAAAFARPRLIVIGGLIGTGKSTLARSLAEALQARWLRTDEIRLREFAHLRTGGQGFGEGLYAGRVSAMVYRRLIDRAEQIIAQGGSVVCDGTFSKHEGRQALRRIARRHGASFHFFECAVPRAVALRRIARRYAAGSDLSEAQPEHYDLLAADYEPARGWPALHHTRFQTNQPVERTYRAAVQILQQHWT